jgi:hypothetical protein
VETIEIGKSQLSYRHTPWDEKSFEMPTREIIGVDYCDENMLNQLIDGFEETLTERTLIYFRHDSNDQIVKKALLLHGYYIVEASLKIKLTKVQKIDFSKIYRNNLDVDEVINESDIRQISDIAYDSFNYSRFHEDPFLDIEKSRSRYASWISDLVKQKKNIYIYRLDGEVVSFQFYTLNGSSADLILGGSKNGYGMMSPYFFSTIMTNLQKKGIKKIETMISASNIGILNTFISFGYMDQKTFFDYHKIFDVKQQR